MLQQAAITVMLPVKNLERARAFYESCLGFEPGERHADGKYVYMAAGAYLALFPKEEGTRAEHTAISFKVDDIASAIRELQGRGVAFADYDYPGLQTVDHVCVLGAEKAAWFEDTEGNCLCLHEDIGK
jgi:catechol 2,3-dioxygenase-like lactoylglutathione lyase family enzyme